MDGLFGNEEHKKLLDALREKAPSIYVRLCATRIREINQKLYNLRIEYRILRDKKEKTPEDLKKMRELEHEGQRLNEQLTIYQVVS